MEEQSTTELPSRNGRENIEEPCRKTDQLTVDEALEVTRCYGRFQLMAQIIFSYLVICMGYQSVMSFFISDEAAWTCISKNTSSFCTDNYGISIEKDNVNFSRRCHLRRNEWTYSGDRKYSFATEFDLICDSTSLAALASGVYHIGGAFGVPIAGMAADKYGRKYSLLVCLVLNSIVSVGCSYVKNSLQLIVARVFLGATGWSIYNIAYVYMGEFVTPKYRSISGNMVGLSLSLSILVIDVCAYYCRLWRQLQFYVSFPCLLVVVFLAFLPDSPRWYLANKRNTKDAEAVIKLIGKYNKYSGAPVTLKIIPVSNEASNTYLDLIRNGKILLMSLLLGLIWLTAGMSFYMISFESSNIGGDMYLSFAYATLAAMPSNVVAIYPLNRFGRKRCVLVVLVITGALTGSTTLIPSTYVFQYTLKMILLSCAEFSANCILLGCYIWTFEIFPTALRLQGWGICIALERIGSFSAPFLTTVLHQFNPKLPYLCVMCFAFISALGGFFLPETNNMGTREGFDDFFDSECSECKDDVVAYDNTICKKEDIIEEADCCESKQ